MCGQLELRERRPSKALILLRPLIETHGEHLRGQTSHHALVATLAAAAGLGAP